MVLYEDQYILCKFGDPMNCANVLYLNQGLVVLLVLIAFACGLAVPLLIDGYAKLIKHEWNKSVKSAMDKSSKKR